MFLETESQQDPWRFMRTLRFFGVTVMNPVGTSLRTPSPTPPIEVSQKGERGGALGDPKMKDDRACIWGLPKMPGAFLGVHITRTIVFGGSI